MAGDHQSVKLDPAIERWANMRENVYLNFKFTPRKTRFLLIWGLAIPALTVWGSWHFHGMYDFRAVRKGESIYRQPKKAPTPPADE